MATTRKIKEAKDLNSGELIYFKGHAKATYMSDGTTVEDAINNIEGGGGNQLYFTTFTVEDFIEGCVIANNIGNYDEEFLNAVKNNKIICVPYRDYDKGFAVASYKSKSNENEISIYDTTIFIEHEGVKYTALLDDEFGNIIYGCYPDYNQTKSVIVSDIVDNNVQIELVDNCIYKITEPLNYLQLLVSYFSVGTTVIFMSGIDGTSLTLSGNESISWANGEIPTIEPNTCYELSMIGSIDGSTNIILTPFKSVNQ